MSLGPDAEGGEVSVLRHLCWEGQLERERTPAEVERGSRVAGTLLEESISSHDNLGLRTKGERNITGFSELVRDTAAIAARWTG